MSQEASKWEILKRTKGYIQWLKSWLLISTRSIHSERGGFLCTFLRELQVAGELYWTQTNSELRRQFKKDNYGQLWVSASRLFSRSGWMDWHHLHYGAAPMEAVLVRRGRHHHGRGLVRRPVDVLCISEHGPGAVQDLWLLALSGWWVLNQRFLMHGIVHSSTIIYVNANLYEESGT